MPAEKTIETMPFFADYQNTGKKFISHHYPKVSIYK